MLVVQHSEVLRIVPYIHTPCVYEAMQWEGSKKTFLLPPFKGTYLPTYLKKMMLRVKTQSSLPPPCRYRPADNSEEILVLPLLRLLQELKSSSDNSSRNCFCPTLSPAIYYVCRICRGKRKI